MYSQRLFLIFLLFFLLNLENIDSQVFPNFKKDVGSFSIAGEDSKSTLFTSTDVKLLPAGTSTGYLLEYWYLPSVVTNLDKGGFATTEPIIVNTQGGSVFWQKYWFENMDISDPIARGKPFIDLPVKVWKEFSINSILSNYGNFQGYHWRLPLSTKESNNKERILPNQNNFIKTEIALTSLMGGDSLTARGLFDREPAQFWGAPQKRRHFFPSYEVNLKYEGIGLFSQPAIVFTEFLSHNRSFLQIGNKSENNYRISSVVAQKFNKNNAILLLYQGNIREYAGVEKTQKEENSLKEYQQNFILNFTSKISEQDQWNYQAGLGFGFGERKGRQDELYLSIQDEIIQGTPELPRTHQVFFTDLSVEKKNIFYLKSFFKTLINFSGRMRFELTSQQFNLENIKIIRYDESLPLDILFHEASSDQIDMLFRIRPKIFFESKFNLFNLKIELGLLSENLFSELDSAFYRISPTASIKLIYPTKKKTAQVILGLQHEAIPSTLKESEFLNKNSVSSRRERWIDANADLRFQQGEEAGILYRSGGAYHQTITNLKHPVLEEIFLGSNYYFLKIWQISLNLTGKWYRNLYWVDYAEDFQSGYHQIKRDKKSGGLLYNRNPGSYGQERYVLINRDNDSFFANIDIQLLKKAITSWWFVNITLGTYIHLASNLVGNGATNNDIASYSELSADPNRNINLFGRTDYDRGYIANLLFGFYLWEGLTWTNIIHYRDGVPFGNFITARGLSQGSLPIMSSERGGGLEGIGRYTFYLNWDIRVHYRYQNYSITFDIYNLLESSTETLENPFINQFRRPLDSTTPRSFRLLFSYQWDT